MMLGRWNGLWVGVSASEDHSRGFSLVAPNALRDEAIARGFVFDPLVRALIKAVPEHVDLQFFPTIEYRGCPVHAKGWHRESNTLTLLIDLAPHNLLLTSYFEVPPKREDVVRAMRADGWDWDPREGGAKYVAIDELHLVEGEAPPGRF